MKENKLIILSIIYATLIGLGIVYLNMTSTIGLLLILAIILFPACYQLWKNSGDKNNDEQ